MDGSLRETTADHAFVSVLNELQRMDPTGIRWSGVIRRTYDMVYNGQDTGRYRWDQLMKTEKTHFGSLFEINAQREFDFASGDKIDFSIAGNEVDAKWSQKDGGWMLPPEVFDEIALVCTGSDLESKWSLGLIRVTSEVRRTTVNRDQKSMLSLEGRRSVHWIWRDAPLRPNILLQLPRERVDYIINPQAYGRNRSGTWKLCELFKEAEGRIVHRSSVATVAQQLDPQKRLRYNGGARDPLELDGILVLSGHYHGPIARAFGVQVPKKDEYISVRVVPADVNEGAFIGGRWWRRARPEEEVSERAPRIG